MGTHYFVPIQSNEYCSNLNVNAPPFLSNCIILSDIPLPYRPPSMNCLVHRQNNYINHTPSYVKNKNSMSLSSSAKTSLKTTLNPYATVFSRATSTINNVLNPHAKTFVPLQSLS